MLPKCSACMTIAFYQHSNNAQKAELTLGLHTAQCQPYSAQSQLKEGASFMRPQLQAVRLSAIASGHLLVLRK